MEYRDPSSIVLKMRSRRMASFNRAKVRVEFERHFTAERMAGDYLAIYQELVQAKSVRVRWLQSGTVTGSHAVRVMGSSLNKRAAESPDLGG
jgi:hypothetical protein